MENYGLAGNRQYIFAISTRFSSFAFSVSEGTFAEAYAYCLGYDGVIATSDMSIHYLWRFFTATGSVTSPSKASTTVSESVVSSSAYLWCIQFHHSLWFNHSAASATSSTSGSTSAYTTTLNYIKPPAQSYLHFRNN
ncbi:hypothetical protein GRS66_007910 [Saccharomyces pastorianus]|uniref:Uncharacterized protein n=1 Tax=Saccharomyces pastorianus TaxID=27292 RepID=A0A6C1E8H8_SACPS|nr:hypothetical protein GRS66_007910 [Saccharomyces pastorianus]